MTLPGQPLEAARVDTLRLDLEHVGSRVGLDRSVVSERRSQPREVGAQRRRRTRGRRPVPQLFDEPLRSERTAGLNREQRQQGALSRSTQRDPCIAARRLDGSEQAQLEALRASFRSHRSILGGMRCTGNRSSNARSKSRVHRVTMADVRMDIVGRDEELAALLDLVGRAAEGAAALVLEGEAGIGKSTLWLAGVDAAQRAGAPCALRAARRVRAGSRVRRARRPPRGRRRRSAAGALGAAPSSARGSASARGRGRLAADPRAVAVAVHDTLVELATRGALLLAIDDVQWLDPASANALSFALRRLDREPIGILLARRGEAPAALEPALPGAVERLSVGPLSVGAIQGLIRDRLGLRFPRPTLLRLHDASGGNPFFALELARALDAGAPLDPAQPLPVPDSLEHLVGERLRALPEETRKALLVVAVTGSPALEVMDAAGIDEETLAPAVAAEVVERANGVIRFTHPLLASAAIAEATVAERRTAHRLASVAADDPVARARHVAAALEGEDAATARQLEEAVELARARGAPWVAAELGEAAAQATPRTREADRRRRIIQAARDHLAAGSAARALTLARDLVEAARPGPSRAEALGLLAEVENAIDVSTGVDHCRQALREPGLPPELELELHRELAFSLRVTEGLAAAEAHAHRAVALAEQVGSDLLEARTLATLAVIRFNQGEPEAFALAQRAVELALQAGDATTIEAATSAWGHCLLWSGRIAEARSVFEHASRSTAGNDEPAEASALWYLALVEERAGQLALARAHAERSRELMFQYAGHELDEPAAHLPLARIAAHQGDVELARDLAARAHVYAEAQGGMSTGRAALALLGTLDLWAGEPLRALERFEIYAEQAAAAGFSTSIAIHIADHVEALSRSDVRRTRSLCSSCGRPTRGSSGTNGRRPRSPAAEGSSPQPTARSTGRSSCSKRR